MTNAAQPIDLSHLAQYTGGDRELDAELLELFSQQCRTMIGQLELFIERADFEAWRDTTHSLKGAAAGIGAFDVAEWAGRAERVDPATQKADATACLQQLRSCCEIAQGFIAHYLKQ